MKHNGTAAMIVLATLALTAAFALGTRWYVHWSPAHLPALADDLGEVWMERGARCEAAGALDEARADYEYALAGRFHGPQNRNHCEKRLGVVLLKLGRYDEARSFLQQAQASPHRSINGYGPLIDALVALERWDEAEAAAKTWLAAWSETGHTGDSPHLALVRIALARGDIPGARQWLDASGLAPHEHGAARARLLALEGDLAAACEALSAHLRVAPPGPDTAQDWALLETWSSQLGR